MSMTIHSTPSVKLTPIAKKMAGSKDKIEKISPCCVKDYLEKGKEELIYQRTKFKHVETTSLKTPENSLIDIYV